jgi:hypothetical protein
MRSDAIIDPIAVPAISGDRLLDLLIAFFNDRPNVVRGEVSLVMAALWEEKFIFLNEEFDYEYAVRGLFNAPTRLRRLGNLINVIAVFDVYFSGDPELRLGSLLARYNQLCGTRKDPALEAARDRCAGQLAAIQCARDGWRRLRNAELTTAALSAALVPDCEAPSDGDSM